MGKSRKQLLQRLDTIEKRVATLVSVDPVLDRLGTRMAAQQTERERARARLEALDEKLAKLTQRRAATDVDIQESVRTVVNDRLASAAQETESRLSRKPAVAAGQSSQTPEPIMARVVSLETAVAAQRNVIAELHNCSMRNEERMQRLLTSVDSLISGNLRRSSR